MAKKTTTAATNTATATSKLERLFADYPKVNELYTSTDGMAFFTENDARNYAALLKDSEVKTIKRQ